MAKQNKQDKLIAQLRAQIVDLNEEVDAHFIVGEERAEKIEALEAEANDLFDDVIATENDRDYYKSMCDANGALADSALDQRDELAAKLAETKDKLEHALDAVANVLIAGS